METATAERDPRPLSYFASAHAYTRGNPGGLLYWVWWMGLGYFARTFFKARVTGRENVPREGPVLIAPNHASSWDHCLLTSTAGRRISIMAKSELFHFPVRRFWSHCGAFPVRRGWGDEEALATARSVLDGAGAVLIYCEGTRSKDGSLASRPRTGIGRLALETGAPVLPVAINWTHRLSVWRGGIRVKYGKAEHYGKIENPTRDQGKAVSAEIFRRIEDLYRPSDPQGA